MERDLVGRYEVFGARKKPASGAYPDVALSVACDEASSITGDEGVGGELIACTVEAGGNTLVVALHDVDAILEGGQPDSAAWTFIEAVDLIAA